MKNWNRLERGENMRYLPILGELFASDTIHFFLLIRFCDLLELILLFAGTIALGGILDFFAGIVVSGVRKC